MKKTIFYGTLMAAVFASSAFAHFPMLTCDTIFGESNQPVQIVFAVGHPYEQEYENAMKPERVTAILPNGNTMDLTAQLQEKKIPYKGESVIAWNLEYKPRRRGDTIIALDTKPHIGENNTLYQEYVKLIVHTESERGWRQRTGKPLEIVPLTRPYGIEEGEVFTAQLMKGDAPVADETVYIERFLMQAPDPDDLPPEPLITKSVVTDPNGVFSCTLLKPGWWICAAEVDDLGKIERDGKTMTLEALTGLWIHVEKKQKQ